MKLEKQTGITDFLQESRTEIKITGWWVFVYMCICVRALARARYIYTYSCLYVIKLKIKVTESALKYNFTGTRT